MRAVILKRCVFPVLVFQQLMRFFCSYSFCKNLFKRKCFFRTSDFFSDRRSKRLLRITVITIIGNGSFPEIDRTAYMTVNAGKV